MIVPTAERMSDKIRILFNYKKMLLVLAAGLLLISCSEKEHITEVNFDELEFAPFVEREFPFITTFLLVTDGESEELFPENNVVSRCLALILSEESYACFDTDMLRWAAAWTGEFVPLEGVSQKAYPDFLSRNDKMPYLTETPHLVTGLYPGWSVGEPQFSDPRPPAPHPDEPSWGPIPQEMGRWSGVYMSDEGPVLSYSIAGIDILETPGSIESEKGTVFTRTIRIDSPDREISLVAGEVPGATEVEAGPNRVAITHQDGVTGTIFELWVTNGSAELQVHENRYVTVQVREAGEPVGFSLYSRKGNAEIERIVDDSTLQLPDINRGWTNPWPETVYTRGKVAPDTSTYVVDDITLPIPNPWNRNVRVVDSDFFEDGRAALVTFEGDVWIADGISHNLNSISWNRFASGLYETQSIKIVNGQIYTYGKDGIVRLHDLNGDGAADFYENFSNAIAQSVETREWASDMVAKPGGGFYVAKGAALDMGPKAFTEPVSRGIRAGSQHSGVILEISADGKHAEIVASGLRGPYLGIHPESGIITASDQEGHHVPSSPILVIEQDDYFGVPATAHRDPIPDITPSLLWIPHNVDRSGMSQVWITGDRMGPLNGDLVHLSYGRPGLFRVLIDSTSAGVQGATTVIPGHYPVPTMKGTVSPADGQLYVTGFTLWGTNSDGMTGFLRLRYTGLPSYMPSGFSAGDGGIVVQFDEVLDEESVRDVSNYRVERWNYFRAETYGSGHYRLDGSPGQELLPVFSAHLSDDGRGVFLAVPNIVEAEQMQVSYDLRAADGTKIKDDFWFSVLYPEEIDLSAEGFSGININDLLAGESARDGVDATGEPVTLERGKELFQRTGCMGCHTTDGSVGTGVGPTLKNLFGKERRFGDGSTTTADEDYIRHKLLYPSERILEGYDEGMPSFLGILSDDEIDSIVLYIISLSD